MAKKKEKPKSKEQGSGENNKPSLDAYLEKTFGKGIIVRADTIVDRPRQILPTVLSLDVALSGGIPEGSVVLITGKPKGGKTTLCLEIQANAILQGRRAIYFNIERRITASLIKTIRRLDPSKLDVFPPPGYTGPALSAQQVFDALENIIKQNPRACIVVDSLAALCTETELAEKVGDKSDMSGVPKLLSQFFRKLKDIVDANNSVLIFISQVQTNRDPTSKKKFEEKGGMAVQYAASVWLSLDWFQVWKKDEATQESYGQDVHFTVKASALGKPYRPCSIPLRFGEGIDQPMELIRFGENLGLIEVAGSWYSIPEYEGRKFQGAENLRAAITGDPGLEAYLRNEVRASLFPEASTDGSASTERSSGEDTTEQVPEGTADPVEVSVPK